MTGIYKITNLITNMSYIGQSLNIEKRWNEEKRRAFLKNDKSYNYPLSKAFRKYGLKNFSFEILEECSQNFLNEKEKFYISKYNTFYNGYNQTLGGDNAIIKPKENIIDIIQDLENTDMLHREIAEKWNISIEMVQGINTGRYWYQENKNYPLQKQHKNYSQGIKASHKCQNCGKEISQQATLCVECYRIKSRKVPRPELKDLQDYLILIKGNFSQAANHFGVSDNTVRKWCKNYNIPYHSKDYKK